MRLFLLAARLSLWFLFRLRELKTNRKQGTFGFVPHPYGWFTPSDKKLT